GRYNPGTDNWAATSPINPPDSRDGHTAVWADSQMIVWGGLAAGPMYLNTGGRYCAAVPSPSPTPTPTPTTTPNPFCTDNTWTPTSLSNAPAALLLHTAVWTGSEMIVWGGYNGSDFN